MLEKWGKVEIPKDIKTFEKAEIQESVKSFIISFVIGWVLIWIVHNSIQLLPTYRNGGYDLVGNAIVFLLYLALMMVPAIIGAYLKNKKNCPTYGFLSVIGFMAAGATYSIVDLFVGIYALFLAGLILVANIIKPGEYKLKWWQLCFYFLFGVVVNIIHTYVVILFNQDVWTYLQFVYIHLFTTILISLKIRQWGYFFQLGWIVYSIYYMIYVDLLLGIYIFFAPTLMTGGVIYYFFKIWRNISEKFRNPDEKEIETKED
jgi:hypothetical protein